MWGISLDPANGVTVIDSWDALTRAHAQENSTLWVDFESPTADELRQLDALIDLDDDALEDCLGGEPRPRIAEYDDYLLVVAYGVIVPEGQVELEARKLAIFRGERYLITIHTEPSRSVAGLKERSQKLAESLLQQGVDHLLYRLIDGMVDRYLSLIERYEDEIEEFEARSIHVDNNGDFLADASHLRRQLIEIRRLAAAQRELLEPLASGDYDYVSSALSPKFRRVEDHLLHALDRVDGLRDRLNAAFQNYNAVLAKRTNDVMRILTVLTAVMLPLSLIAGIYGMNVQVWPGENTAWSFWAILGVMGLIGGGMVGLFRWLRWI